MPMERALEIAQERMEAAEAAGDYAAAVRWADALDRVIRRRNAKLAAGPRHRPPRRPEPARLDQDVMGCGHHEVMKIGIVNTKGGVGKTTTALFLAAAALRKGRTVEVQDLDKQASATRWLEKAGPVPGLTATVANSYTVGRPAGAQVVIVDTSPGDPRDVELAAESCDFVVVPSSPGEMNDERTRQTVAYLASKGVAHAVVLVQADDRTRATRASRDGLLGAAAVFETEIPRREAIRNAHGTIPADLHGYDALWEEIESEAGAA